MRSVTSSTSSGGSWTTDLGRTVVAGQRGGATESSREAQVGAGRVGRCSGRQDSRSGTAARWCSPTSPSASTPATVSASWGPTASASPRLLRVLAGLETPDAGTVTHRPPTLTVGYLPQEPDPHPGETLLAYLERRTGVAEANAELDRWTAELGRDADAIDAYTAALDHFLALGGDDFEARAAQTCASVGLLGDDQSKLGQPMATLSGGEAARALLAAILLSRHDVLLLDEPTNNLDFAGLDQLEAFMASLPRRGDGGVARPGVPRPLGHPHPRDRGELPPRPRVRRRLVGVPRRPRPRPPAAVRRPRQVHLASAIAWSSASAPRSSGPRPACAR